MRAPICTHPPILCPPASTCSPLTPILRSRGACVVFTLRSRGPTPPTHRPLHPPPPHFHLSSYPLRAHSAPAAAATRLKPSSLRPPTSRLLRSRPPSTHNPSTKQHTHSRHAMQRSIAIPLRASSGAEVARWPPRTCWCAPTGPSFGPVVRPREHAFPRAHMGAPLMCKAAMRAATKGGALNSDYRGLPRDGPLCTAERNSEVTRYNRYRISVYLSKKLVAGVGLVRSRQSCVACCDLCVRTAVQVQRTQPATSAGAPCNYVTA